MTMDALSIENIGGGTVDSNIFLVGSGPYVIVDAGTGIFRDRVLARLNKVLGEEEYREIRAILLTHAHFDHCGGAGWLARRVGGVPVLAHASAHTPLKRGDGMYTGAYLFGQKMTPLETVPIDDGWSMDLGCTRLRALHTPGHHPSSLVFVSDRGDCFTGDLIFADGGVGRWDLPGGDLKELTHSAERLSRLEIVRIFPGHGPSVLSEARSHLHASLRVLQSCTG